jgi:plastocyanin
MTTSKTGARRPRSLPLLLAAVALLAVALLVIGCSSSTNTYGNSPATTQATPTTAAAGGGTATTTAAGATAGTQVEIKNFSFSPASLTVKAGDTVTWTNNDTATHTVTADDNSFTSSDLAPGASFKHTFAKAGTVAYHCSIHPSMTATVVVQ